MTPPPTPADAEGAPPPVRPKLPPVTPSMAFDEASTLVLDYLTEHIPMGYWSVSRVENGQQTHIRFNDEVYDLSHGHGLAWEKTFCIHMVEGWAPRITPDTSAVPEFVAAQQGIDIAIGSYAGVPIVEADGSLFGVLCGHDPEPRDASFADHLPLLELVTALLNMVLAADRTRDVAMQVARHAQLTSETDDLTGLHNRRAWHRLMEDEEERYSRYADPTVVVFVDVDGLKAINDEGGHLAGDRHLKRVAAALTAAVRSHDPVARVGGDEFAVLLRGCSEEEAHERVAGIAETFADADVSASIGWAAVRADRGFDAAYAEADAAMYADKKRAPDAS